MKVLDHKTTKTYKRYVRSARGVAPPSGLFGDAHGRGIRLASESHFNSPAERIGMAIRNALDPTKAPGKVTSLADMSPEKRAEMARLYPGAKGQRP